MKKTSYIIFILLTGLFSCTKEIIAPIESFSIDKEMKVSVFASRANALDSWMLEIVLNHGGKNTKVFQEFYADEVSKSNVSFQWKSNRMCLVQFTQRDGIVINVPIEVHD